MRDIRVAWSPTGTPTAWAMAERTSEGSRTDERLTTTASQVGLVGNNAGHAQGEPGFADAARASQGEQAQIGLVKEGEGRFNFVGATHQRRQRPGNRLAMECSGST